MSEGYSLARASRMSRKKHFSFNGLAHSTFVHSRPYAMASIVVRVWSLENR